MCLAEDYSRHIFVKLLSKYLQRDSNKGQFSLFHYKSMETLSSHSNESTRETSTRNATFVEANVMNISAKL